MVLFAVLAVLAGLALLCATIFTITSTDMRITGSFVESKQAFHQADSGVHYVKSRIEDALAAGTLTLSNTSAVVSYAAPPGYAFVAVTSLSHMAAADNPCHAFTVCGTSGLSKVCIEVTFQRRPALAMGVFGDSAVDMKNSAHVYSYYSAQVLNPAPSNSTGEADIGSNESITTHVDAYLDGDLQLGQDLYGNVAVWADPGDGAVITGLAGQQVGRVDPDPLGIVGGPLATRFAQVASANDNAAAVPPIVGNRINLGNGDTLLLKPGNYYLTQLTLGNNATILVNSTGGVVNLYLNGRLDLKNSSTINNNGRPTGLNIYCKSSDRIQFYNSSAFRGLLYAPLAEVNLLNSGDFLGAVWGDDVELKNSGDVYVDMSLLNRILSNKIRLLSWKEVR